MHASAFGTACEPLDLSWATAYPLSFLPTREALRPTSRPRAPERARTGATPPATTEVPQASAVGAAEALRPAQKRTRADSTDASRADATPRHPLDDFDALMFDITAFETSISTRTRPLVNKPAQKRTRPAHLAPTAVTPIAPRPTTPRLPVVLGSDVLFPDPKRLRWSDYEPYLLQRSTEPRWSGPFYNRFLHFLCACEPPEHWTDAPERLTMYNRLPAVAKLVGEHQPNKRVLQAVHRPRAAQGYATLTESMSRKFCAMCCVMQWLWDDPSLSVDAVADLVQRAPLAVHIIVREYAGILRSSELASRAEADLVFFLSSRPALTRRQQAARKLLAWLRHPAAPDRHLLFFCRPGGELRVGSRGEMPWAWWFAKAQR
ncbi:hypothetical protein JCM3770_000944 [Rhodotorula araucariae]